MAKKQFVKCECGKKLVERLPNGLLKFQFGRRPKDADNKDECVPVVEMVIRGDVNIRCLSNHNVCDRWTEIKLFPFTAL